MRLCRGNRVVNRIRGVVKLPSLQGDVDHVSRGHVHEHVRFNRCLALCGWRFDLLDDGVVRVRLVRLCEKVVAVTESDSPDGIRLWELDEDHEMRLSRNRIRIGQRYNSLLGDARRLYTSGLFHRRHRFRLREAGDTASANQCQPQGESSDLSHGCNTSSL